MPACRHDTNTHARKLTGEATAHRRSQTQRHHPGRSSDNALTVTTALAVLVAAVAAVVSAGGVCDTNATSVTPHVTKRGSDELNGRNAHMIEHHAQAHQ
jgi:hypothetical protein